VVPSELVIAVPNNIAPAFPPVSVVDTMADDATLRIVRLTVPVPPFGSANVTTSPSA
jgi:hypothetical protein